MAIHPRCPCSTASLEELAETLDWQPEACDLVLLAYKPEGEQDSWVGSVARGKLDRFHPRVVIDPGGAMAARLGAKTSGHVVAYDTKGQLSFSGGMTAARGHRGKTAAHTALRDLLRGEGHEPLTAPVFGCSIQDENPIALKP